MSYMPVAVSYRSRATAAASSGAPERMDGASAKRGADAVLEGRRLPAELLLCARRVGRRVPEQELELPARDERRDAEARGQEVAGRGDGARQRNRHHGWHAAAARHPHDRLGELAERDVAIAEDVTLAVAAVFRREQLPPGDAVLVHHAHAARRDRRHAPARDGPEHLLVERD